MRSESVYERERGRGSAKTSVRVTWRVNTWINFPHTDSWQVCVAVHHVWRGADGVLSDDRAKLGRELWAVN